MQTHGLSHFFGCRPLGPISWSVALTASAGATLGGALWNRIEPQVLSVLNELLQRKQAADHAAEGGEPSAPSQRPLTAADLLRAFIHVTARS